jgi:hypothetical protein
MPRTPYYESDNPSTVVRGATWRAGVWIVCAVVFFALIGVGIWAFNVATSDVKGQGDATRQVNTGDNRLAQQAYFEQTYADIKAADQNLDVPGTPTEMSGRVIYCRRLVADYNAAARKQIASKFRAADLPAQIDTSDPTTDCTKG